MEIGSSANIREGDNMKRKKKEEEEILQERT
jgi:hypothetical protein